MAVGVIHTYQRKYAVNRLMILQRRHGTYKSVGFKPFDFIYKQKNKSLQISIFILCYIELSIVILGKILIAKFYIILDRNLIETKQSLHITSRDLQSRKIINYLKKGQLWFKMHSFVSIQRKKESVLPYSPT